MGQLIEQFRNQYAPARVLIEYAHPDTVYEKVLGRTAEIGLVSFPRKQRELNILPWRDEEMMLACGPDHPLTRVRSIAPEHLEGQRWVAFTKDLMIRRRVDQYLRERGITVAVQSEFDTIEIIKRAIEVGQGVSLLPEPTFRQEVGNGLLVARPLDGERFLRPIGIIHRRQPRLSQPALRFIELLQGCGNSTAPTAQTAPSTNGHVANGSNRRASARAGSRKR
jgi:DNA-binding transcriptional LysR family regulator